MSDDAFQADLAATKAAFAAAWSSKADANAPSLSGAATVSGTLAVTAADPELPQYDLPPLSIEGITGYTPEIPLCQAVGRGQFLSLLVSNSGSPLILSDASHGTHIWGLQVHGPCAGITKASVGLDQVDNTSDLSKPISSATQAALDLKAAVSALAAYVTSSSLSSTLSSYVTSSGLTSTLSSYATTSSLSSYVTSSGLSSTLASYVTSSGLTSTLSSYATTSSLSSYVTNSSLASTLSSYVTSSGLTSTLSSYATTSSLSSYVTNSSLASTLSSYVTSSGLTSTLSSYATTSSLSSYAPLASPALTGAPTAPTQTSGDNSTKIASTAFVSSALSSYAPLASPSFTGTPTGSFRPYAAGYITSTGVATSFGQIAITSVTHTASSGTYQINLASNHPLGSTYGVYATPVSGGPTNGMCCHATSSAGFITVAIKNSSNSNFQDYPFCFHSVP